MKKMLDAVVILFLMSMSGCGGGGGGSGAVQADQVTPCTRRVASGATAGIISGADYDGGGGGAGGGDGGGGDGGAGGAEGQFRKALIHIEQADGVVVGEAEVDDTHGMVKFVLCGFEGTVKFTVKAKADGSTTYYDESKNAPLRFPAGEEIRAVVPKYEKNVGVTPLTEAAYQYLIGKYGPDGWKDAAKVREANDAIRTEVNRMLPAGLQIEDITRLPVIVGSAAGTATGSKLPATKNGLYGTVVSGIAIAAGLYKTDSVLPALEISRQFGKDLSDGRLDLFYCLNGAVANPADCQAAPVLSAGTNPAQEATYVASQVAEMTNTGVSLSAARVGTSENANAALRFTQVKLFPQRALGVYQFDDNTPMFLLRNDGAVYLWLTRSSPLTRYATGFRQLYSQATVLGSTFDGRVFANPTITFPTTSGPATVSNTLTERPSYFGTTKIGAVPEAARNAAVEMVRKQDAFAYTASGTTLISSGRDNVVDVAVLHNVGRPGYLAALADGRVAVWSGETGRIRESSLGLGADTSAPPTTPTINPLLSEIVAVAGFETGGFAIDRRGRAWGWGGGRQDAGASGSPVPVLIAALNAFGELKQIQCGAILQCVAMTRTSELIVWGGPDFSAPVIPPTKVSLPAGRRPIYIGATDYFGYGMLDDGRIFTVVDGTKPPQILDPSLVPTVD